LRVDKIRWKLQLALVPLLLVAAMLYAYNYMAMCFYKEDFDYFMHINWQCKLSSHGNLRWLIEDIPINIIHVVRDGYNLDHVIYPVSLIISIMLLFTFDNFRSKSLVIGSALWIICFFVSMSITPYHPVRYYLTITIPIVFLLSIAISSRLERNYNRYVGVLLYIFVAYGIVMNWYCIGSYMLRPAFTFVNMSHEVKAILDNNSVINDRSLLIGNMADSISLETGCQTINSVYGAKDLSWRLGIYKPTHYISYGTDGDTVMDRINNAYFLEEIKSFDVYDDYCPEEEIGNVRGIPICKTRLFKLIRK
jgi:hypothetical protein